MGAVRIRCPRCRGDADLVGTPACRNCGWAPPITRGVISLLDEADRQDPVLAGYLANYDQIADDDLTAPILGPSYVRYQAENLARYAGPVAGLRILDLGCGQGVLTRLFQERGAASVVALDLSMAYLERLAHVPNVIPVQANAERLLFTEAFDMVVSTDVMEHVLNLGSFLVSLNHLLRTDGVAIVRVPYRESLIGYSRQAGCKYPFVHLRTFDRRTLKDAMNSAGFELQQTWLDGFNLSSPRPACIATKNREYLYGWLQQWLLKRLPEPTVVTTWPWPIAATIMTPKEIVVKARKVREILPHTN